MNTEQKIVLATVVAMSAIVVPYVVSTTFTINHKRLMMNAEKARQDALSSFASANMRIEQELIDRKFRDLTDTEEN